MTQLAQLAESVKKKKVICSPAPEPQLRATLQSIIDQTVGSTSPSSSDQNQCFNV